MIRRSILIISLILTLAMGLWAYKINYASRATFLRVESLQEKIEFEKNEIRTLKAEWEFLNRPKRLQKLVEYYFEDLRLIPISPKNIITYNDLPNINSFGIKPTKVRKIKTGIEKED